MSIQYTRVTPGEVNDFLTDALTLTRSGLSASRENRLAYQERKAELLSRIAAEIDTAEAHAIAAHAWCVLAELRACGCDETPGNDEQNGGDR